MKALVAGLLIGAVSFVAPLVAPKSAGRSPSAARNVRSGAIFGALIAVQLTWLIAKRIPGSIGWLAVSLLLVATAQVAGRTLEKALQLIEFPGVDFSAAGKADRASAARASLHTAALLALMVAVAVGVS